MTIRASQPRVPLSVTTSATPDGDLIDRAERLAADLGLPFVLRHHKQGLVELLQRNAQAFLVVEKSGVSLADGASRLKWSPQLATLRIGRLDAGVREDTLVRLAEFATGDRVLDCTMGLAQDTLVAAHAVGAGGQVVALEKSVPLFAIVSDGLSRYGHTGERAPVDVRREDCADFLRRQRPQSFDVVLFDPMFSRPRKSSEAFEMLRRYADYSPLTKEMLTEAQLVARRWVLVKASRYSRDLKALALTPETGSRFATVLWARLRPRGG